MPTVSVIVPVYNIETTLRSCVASIVNQTYQNLEVILVDDGSTDQSGAICKELASLDKRIKVFHQENGGASSARNTGIDQAKGDYICFVDGDDLIHAKMIEFLVRFASTDQDVDIVTCKLKVFQKDFNTMGTMDWRYAEMVSGDEALLRLLYQKIINGPVAKLFKTSLFNEVRFPLGVRVGEDLLTNITIFRKSSKVITLDQAMYGYFMRGGSAMSTASFEDRMILIRHLENNIKHMDFPGPIIHALGSRIFIEAVYASILLHIQKGGGSLKEKRSLSKIMRSYRGYTAVNREAKPFFRMLATLSYLSLSLPRCIFNLRGSVSDILRDYRQDKESQ